MDRLRRPNPNGRSLQPARPPRCSAFQPPPASRPPPEPSSPDGRPRKKVRFADEVGSNHTCARPNANKGRAEKSKSQGGNPKTTEYKFFKKLSERSGCRSRSFKLPHQNVGPNISKQKDGPKLDSHNVMSHRKFPTQKITPCSDETPATPLNENIYDEQVKLQASHSEYDNKETPLSNPRDTLPIDGLLTPIIQASFEVTGISRNTDIEPGGRWIFSEKRSKLLKLAAKTVSMESSELLQRRSDFLADIMRRLGANNAERKHHKESTRQSSRHIPVDPRGHSECMLDYRLTDFDSLTERETGRESPSYARNEGHQLMALPWGHERGLTHFLDWRNDLSYRGNEAYERMSLPSTYTTDLSSSDWRRDTVRNHVSNLLLDDVQQHTQGRPASANMQTGQYDHEWDPALSVMLPVSVPNRLSFPCQIEEQCVVPYAISSTSWRPDLRSSLHQCTSSSVELEEEEPKEAGSFNDFDVGLTSRFDQLRAERNSSSSLDHRDGILDHKGFRCISNFHVRESNSSAFNANRDGLDSICSASILEDPFELGSRNLCGSSVGISSLAGPETKYSTEADLFDGFDVGVVQGLEHLPVKFTASSISKYRSGVLDYYQDPKDRSSILSVDPNDTFLDSPPSYSEHPCKQDWRTSCDVSTELWSSVNLRSHGGSLGDVLGSMSNGSSYNDLEDDHGVILVEDNQNKSLFGTSDHSLFGPRSTMDSFMENPMSSPERIRW